jgi:hypothetical protein
MSYGLMFEGAYGWAGPSDRAVWGVCLRPLACWDCGFESHPGAWKSFCRECCVLSGRGLCDGLITRPEESYWLWRVVVCDLETSWMRRHWPNGGRCVKINGSQRTGLPAQLVCQHVIFITHCLPFLGHATVTNMMLICISAPELLHTYRFVTLRGL